MFEFLLQIFHDIFSTSCRSCNRTPTRSAQSPCTGLSVARTFSQDAARTSPGAETSAWTTSLSWKTRARALGPRRGVLCSTKNASSMPRCVGWGTSWLTKMQFMLSEWCSYFSFMSWHWEIKKQGHSCFERVTSCSIFWFHWPEESWLVLWSSQ